MTIITSPTAIEREGKMTFRSITLIVAIILLVTSLLLFHTQQELYQAKQVIELQQRMMTLQRELLERSYPNAKDLPGVPELPEKFKQSSNHSDIFHSQL